MNFTELARDLGVAVNTVKAWISVLEATYQVIVLRPYYANIGKRLVKTPKVYFTDVGTLLLPDRAQGSSTCGLRPYERRDHGDRGTLGNFQDSRLPGRTPR